MDGNLEDPFQSLNNVSFNSSWWHWWSIYVLCMHGSIYRVGWRAASVFFCRGCPTHPAHPWYKRSRISSSWSIPAGQSFVYLILTANWDGNICGGERFILFLLLPVSGEWALHSWMLGEIYFCWQTSIPMIYMIIFFWRQIADETLQSLTLLAIPTSLVSKKSGAIQMSEAVSFCGMFRMFTFFEIGFFTSVWPSFFFSGLTRA